MSKIFTGLELCSGPGGFSEGFMSAKHNNSEFFIAVANDVDENVSNTYMHNHPGTEFVLGSIISEKTKKNIQNAIKKTTGFSSVDIVIGGPPCQGFSHANKKTRIASNPLNRIALDFFEMVRRVNPFAFVLENVPGILSMQNGKVINKIIQNFQDLGYANVDYWVLDAANYGVPQKRKRVFVVGSKNPTKIQIPEQIHSSQEPTYKNQIIQNHKYLTVWDALSDLPIIKPGKKYSVALTYKHNFQNKFQKKIRNGSRIVKNHVVTVNKKEVIHRFSYVPQGGNWQNIPDKIMTQHGQYKDMKNTHSGIYRRLSPREPSVTITNFRKSMLIHPTQNRLLSVREAARLQTFPDTFEFYGPLSSMQQQVSDAVPVNLAKAVAKAMLSHMEKSLCHTEISKTRRR